MHFIYKNSFKRVIDLNIEPKAIEVLEENIGETVSLL